MHHYAKKSLGQHFLKSVPALKLMVSAARLEKKDTVLEIGPGTGTLTAKLLETGAHVVAVEKDRDLMEHLREKFANEIASGQFELIEDDILKFDIEKHFKTPYKLAANIPYYITGAIIRQFLETKRQPECMVLLVQKEVADRIVARDGKESILSISVKAYGIPKYVGKVAARYFSPPPKVDSAIIAVENISKKRFGTLTEEEFFTVVKAGFAHKRKLATKNLALGLKRSDISEIFAQIGIPEKARPEDIPIDTWFAIARAISKAQ